MPTVWSNAVPGHTELIDVQQHALMLLVEGPQVVTASSGFSRAAPGRAVEHKPLESVLRFGSEPSDVELEGKRYHCTRHAVGPSTAILELEPAGLDAPPSAAWHGEICAAIERLGACNDISGLARVATEQLQRLFGWERALFQRINASWDSTAIAEVVAPGLEPLPIGPVTHEGLNAASRQRLVHDRVRVIYDAQAECDRLQLPAGLADQATLALRGLGAQQRALLKGHPTRALATAALVQQDTLVGYLVLQSSTPTWVGPERRGALRAFMSACSDRFGVLAGRDAEQLSTHYERRVRSISNQLRTSPAGPQLIDTILSGCADVLDSAACIASPAEGDVLIGGSQITSAEARAALRWLRENMGAETLQVWDAWHQLWDFPVAREFPGCLAYRLPGGLICAFLRNPQSRDLPRTLETREAVVRLGGAGERLDTHARSFGVHELAAGRSLASVIGTLVERARGTGRLDMDAQDARLKALLQAAGMTTWEMRVADNVFDFDPTLDEALGFAPGELPRTYQALIARAHPDDFERMHKELRSTSAPTFTVDYRLMDASGNWRWFTSRGRVSARDANGNHLVAQGALYDASEKKVLEQRAIVAQRMEATGQLAGGIAHDFNNLLGVVLTSASLLKEDLPANTESHEDVLSILRAGERGVQLTRRLLTFARGQPLETRPLTLRKLLDDMRPLLTTAVGEDVELAIIAAPHLWPVVADDAQLEQVLVNLVVNARDVMPNGGRIELCLSNDPDSLAAASRGLKPGDYVRLDVSDTGPGMPPEVANRVFEPFFTTKPRGQGTGLGLSTSFGILRDHGGHISVQSTPGLGTTFTLLLPRHAGSTLEEQAPVAAPLLQRRPGRVLLAEDDGLLRAVAQRALERAGFSVVAACSGAEALALFEREPLPPDVLVTDVVMPGMNGKELATVLKSRLPGLRVLFVSGYDESRIASRGLEESGDRFLRKPYTPATLERNVLELMSEVPSLRGESVG